MLDLTPFGFTPTENLTYSALLELGPSSGYAVARHLSLARANAYQALDGLVAKGAAAVVGTGPRRYRARHPQSLFATIADDQTRRLDRLEAQLQHGGAEGERGTVQLSGARAIRQLATRTIVRAEGAIRCLLPARELEALAPALRARGASGRVAEAWVSGSAEGLAIEAAGTVNPERLSGYVGAADLLLLHAAGEGVLAAAFESGGERGFWSGDQLLVGLVLGLLDRLTS